MYLMNEATHGSHEVLKGLPLYDMSESLWTLAEYVCSIWQFSRSLEFKLKKEEKTFCPVNHSSYSRKF